MSFSIRTTDPASRARTGVLKLRHGEVRTPAFVPLATKAVVKTLEVREAADLGFDMVLGNTFHLFLTPGHGLMWRLRIAYRMQDRVPPERVVDIDQRANDRSGQGSVPGRIMLA